MKVVKRNRYYCEFCPKAGGSAWHLKRHEDHCTLNPNRKCRVCKMVGATETLPMPRLLAALPDPETCKRPYPDSPQNFFFDDATLTPQVNAAVRHLREMTGNCPACIMAALRQKGIPVPMATEFNWTAEMKAIWRRINDVSEEWAEARG